MRQEGLRPDGHGMLAQVRSRSARRKTARAGGNHKMGGADAAMLCFVINAGGSKRFAITARERSDRLGPGAITSLEVEDYIIVT